MKREQTVGSDEVAEVVREARLLFTHGGTEIERALYAARKQDLLDRMAVHARLASGGEPG